MPKSLKQKLKPYINLILFNTVFAAVLFLLSHDISRAHKEKTLIQDFIQMQYTFQIISFSCFLATKYIGRFFQDKPLLESILRQLPFILPASLAGMSIAAAIQILTQNLKFDNSLLTNYLLALPTVFIITIVVALVQGLIQNKEFKKLIAGKSNPKASEFHKKDLIPETSRKKNEEKTTLSFKSENKYFRVLYDQILYLSADDRQTYIHCDEQTYKTPGVLKNYAEKLPVNIFYRVHKSFLVNINHISHIEYFLGGSYLAHLKDDDETTIPVGRKYAPQLKEKLVNG